MSNPTKESSTVQTRMSSTVVASHRGAPIRRSQLPTGASAITTTSARKTGATSQATARSPATAIVAAAAPARTSNQRGVPPVTAWTADAEAPANPGAVSEAASAEVDGPSGSAADSVPG